MYAKFNGRFPSQNYLLFLDGDNIRGKSGFLLGKEDLMRRATHWSNVMENTHNLVLIYDHGPKHMAHLLEEEGIVTIFSGPGRTADDVIANAIKWCQAYGSNAIVVTADSGLKGRCKKNMVPSSACDMVTIDSNTFIDMLDSIGYENVDDDYDDHVGESNDYVGNSMMNSSTNTYLRIDDKIESYLDEIDFNEVKDIKEDIDIQVALARKRLSLQNQLSSLHKLISNNRGKKRTKKLKMRRDELNARLHRISYKENMTSEKISSNPDNDYLASYLKSKHNSRKRSKERREEETWERVVLAERLHCDLMQRSLVLVRGTDSKQDEAENLIHERSDEISDSVPTASVDNQPNLPFDPEWTNECEQWKDLRLVDSRRQLLQRNEVIERWPHFMLSYCVHINSMEVA